MPVSNVFPVPSPKYTNASLDFICNWLGNLAWTIELEWPGQKAYDAAPMEDFELEVDGTKLGSVKSAANFTFMRIHSAGHMMPYDQPASGLEMLNRWIGGEWVENRSTHSKADHSTVMKSWSCGHVDHSYL